MFDEWKGDKQLIRDRGFQAHCRSMVADAGDMEALVVYLFMIERAGKKAVKAFKKGKGMKIWISEEDEARFAEDLAEQQRLGRIAAEVVLNSPSDSVMSISQVASLCGLPREQVLQSLRKFDKAGMVKLQGDKVFMDADVLSNAAKFFRETMH